MARSHLRRAATLVALLLLQSLDASHADDAPLTVDEHWSWGEAEHDELPVLARHAGSGLFATERVDEGLDERLLRLARPTVSSLIVPTNMGEVCIWFDSSNMTTAAKLYGADAKKLSMAMQQALRKDEAAASQERHALLLEEISTGASQLHPGDAAGSGWLVSYRAALVAIINCKAELFVCGCFHMDISCVTQCVCVAMKGGHERCNRAANALLHIELTPYDSPAKCLATSASSLMTTYRSEPHLCTVDSCLSFYLDGNSFERWGAYFERQLVGSGRYVRVYDPQDADVMLTHHTNMMPWARTRPGQQLINHILGADELAILKKDLQIKALYRSLGREVVASFYPATFALDNPEDCAAFAVKLERGKENDQLWLLKPLIGWEGRHISLVHSSHEILRNISLLVHKEALNERNHACFALRNLVGTTADVDVGEIIKGEAADSVIAQAYVDRPLLWEAKKFSVRFFAHVLSIDPPIVLWSDGYSSRACHAYAAVPPDTRFHSSDDELWKRSHITNTKDSTCLESSISVNEDLRSLLRHSGADPESIDRACTRVLAAAFESWRDAGWLPARQARGNFFTYFADFMIDADHRVWLHEFGWGNGLSWVAHAERITPGPQDQDIRAATLGVVDAADRLLRWTEAGNDPRELLLDPTFLGDGLHLLVGDLVRTTRAWPTTTCDNAADSLPVP